MAAYEEARGRLLDTMPPLLAHSERAHADPAASDYRLRWAAQLDAHLDALADYGAAAEAERLPPSPHIAAFTDRIRQSAAYQNAINRPEAHRALAGQLTSYCIPLPSHARPEPV